MTHYIVKLDNKFLCKDYSSVYRVINNYMTVTDNIEDAIKYSTYEEACKALDTIPRGYMHASICKYTSYIKFCYVNIEDEIARITLYLN